MTIFHNLKSSIGGKYNVTKSEEFPVALDDFKSLKCWPLHPEIGEIEMAKVKSFI